MSALLQYPTTQKAQALILGSLLLLLLTWLAFILERQRRRRDNAVQSFAENLGLDDNDVQNEIKLQVPATRSDLQNGWKSPGKWLRILLPLFAAVSATLGGVLWLASKHEESGEAMFTAANYAGAEAAFRHALKFDHAYTRARLMLARSLLRQQKTQDAIPELQRCAAEGQSNQSVHIVLGDALVALGRPSDAVTEFRKVIALNPKRSDVYVRLGSCLESLRRSDDAVKELRYALTVNPTDVMAYCNLGTLLIAKGRKEEGLSYLKKAVAIAPHDLDARNTLGAALVSSCGDLAPRAASEYRTILALNPEYAAAYFNLGAVLKLAHDNRGALQVFQSFVQTAGLQPDSQIAVMKANQEIKELVTLLNSNQQH